MSFVKDMDYGKVKAASVASRPQILRWRADNSTYNPTEIIRIEIPTSSNNIHLFGKDSFIEGKLNIPLIAANAAVSEVDGNVFSLFSRMRVSHGSNVVEDTQNCGRLWHVLNDIQKVNDARGEDSITKLAFSNLTAAGSAAGLMQPHLKGCTVSAAAGQAAQVFPFSFTLPSAIFGSLCEKSIPLSECTASSFYIELELASLGNFFCDSGGVASAFGAVTVSDIYYNAKCAVLPPDVHGLLMSSTGGKVVIPAVAFKTEAKSVAAAATSFNDKFAYQVSSANAFLWWMTTAGANGSLVHRSVTSRNCKGLTEWQLNINGEMYPSDMIRGKPRNLNELLRAFDMLSSNLGSGVLDQVTYGGPLVDAGTLATDINTADIPHKRFVAGIDLNRFNQSHETLLSGTNTVGQSINLVANFAAVGDAQTLYSALMYDVLYTIQDGLMTANT